MRRGRRLRIGYGRLRGRDWDGDWGWRERLAGMRWVRGGSFGARMRGMAGVWIAIVALLMASGVSGQRVFVDGGDVIHEDGKKKRTNLGAGFSPVLRPDGRVAMLRGPQFGFGDEFDCGRRETKNWVAVYDPATREETILFDRAIRFEGVPMPFCAFSQMQLSVDGSVLYLLGPVYTTSQCLAIIEMGSGSIRFVPGVTSMYVIESGAHRNELIFARRTLKKAKEDGSRYAGYPMFHARADGQVIREISEEYFTVNGKGDTPRLRSYLRRLGGTITVEGRRLP
jgi:hypothetical protein